MDNFAIRILVKEGEVGKILDELTEAQEKIRDCYDRLRNLGVLTIEKATSGEAGGYVKC